MTKENLMAVVGNNLKAYRTMRNMTQEELAEKAGVSISFCANIERGKKGVSIFALRAFADALDITVNHLLYEDCSDQRIENIVVLLQGKPTSFLSWIEKVISLPNEDFLDSE